MKWIPICLRGERAVSSVLALCKSVWSQRESEWEYCSLVSHPLERKSQERSGMRGYLDMKVSIHCKYTDLKMHSRLNHNIYFHIYILTIRYDNITITKNTSTFHPTFPNCWLRIMHTIKQLNRFHRRSSVHPTKLNMN